MTLQVCLAPIFAKAPGEYETGDRPGYVKLYHKEQHESSWKQLGQVIMGQEAGDWFGSSVSISSDGRTLAVGAPGYWKRNDKPGYVRLYHIGDADESLQQLGQDIIGKELGDQFGSSISLSPNGKTVAIGASTGDGDLKNTGYVIVYVLDDSKSGMSWKQLGHEIYGEAANDISGTSVVLSGDGKTLAIGAHWNDGHGDNSGQVRVYEMKDDGNDPSWKKIGSNIDGEASGDLLGFSIALSSDGRILAIGAPGADGNVSRRGYVRIFFKDGVGASSSFKWLGDDIVGDELGDYFGASVSLSHSGKILAIGGYGSDGNVVDDSGHVKVYHLDNSAGFHWTQLGQVISGEGAGEEAGRLVSLSADRKTLAVSSIGDDINGVNAGCVRVFSLF